MGRWFLPAFRGDQRGRVGFRRSHRSLFVVPDAAKRSFFYGVTSSLVIATAILADTLEFGDTADYRVRNKEWEFIVNPIVDVGFGSAGEADFAPAVRLAHNLGDDRFIGLEYYADFGKIGSFLPLQQQSQQLFAVTDFKVKTLDVELGAGYGFTPGSDRLVFKVIIGYDFPVPDKSDSNGLPISPLAMGTSARAAQNPFVVK